MNASAQDPGHATLEELTSYWRMPSERATLELARALGLRPVLEKYPWLAIWQAERLAPPPKKRWGELKHPHLTTIDLAELLGESERSARRREHAKPDASFPDPVPIRKRPKLWRAAQVHAWCAGLPVPVYPLKSRTSQAGVGKSPKPSSPPDYEGFDPFVQKRLTAKSDRKRTVLTNNGKTDEHS